MIDLSPQPQDKSSGTAELHPLPRHDPVPGHPGGKIDTAWWQLSHDRAEAGLQMLSRWAGPVALIVALGTLGWFLFG